MASKIIKKDNSIAVKGSRSATEMYLIKNQATICYAGWLSQWIDCFVDVYFLGFSKTY